MSFRRVRLRRNAALATVAPSWKRALRCGAGHAASSEFPWRRTPDDVRCPPMSTKIGEGGRKQTTKDECDGISLSPWRTRRERGAPGDVLRHHSKDFGRRGRRCNAPPCLKDFIRASLVPLRCRGIFRVRRPRRKRRWWIAEGWKQYCSRGKQHTWFRFPIRDCLCKSQGIMGFYGVEGGQSGLAAGLKNKRR